LCLYRKRTYIIVTRPPGRCPGLGERLGLRPVGRCSCPNNTSPKSTLPFFQKAPSF
jgi:hypothetical protein